MTLDQTGNEFRRKPRERTHRAADDFATIRARLEELRREREQAMPSGKKAQPDLPLPRDWNIHWPLSETNAGPERVPPSRPGTHLGSVWDL